MANQSESLLQAEVKKQVLAFLSGGEAHVGFAKVVADFPKHLRGVRPERVPYSAWQLLEHLRIAQKDILDFTTNGNGAGYQPLDWPKDYWPVEIAPSTESAWDQSIQTIARDGSRFRSLLTADTADFVTPFPWGNGQTLLREAMLIADHTAYHLGELVLLRRLLDAWQS